MEALLRMRRSRKELEGQDFTHFPLPGARRDPRNFPAGPAAFIHEFRERTLGNQRSQGWWLSLPGPDGGFPAGERAPGKEEAPVGGAEVARVGERVSSLIPGLWLPNVPGLEGLRSPKRVFRFTSIFKT